LEHVTTTPRKLAAFRYRAWRRFNPAPPALSLVPGVPLREANAFIVEHHRHHEEERGCLFCLAVAVDNKIVGVAIVGRPKSRVTQAEGFTAEVTRLATDGTKGACSMLYAAAWRAWAAMGGRRLITYTLPEEGGASLRGAGWRCLGERGGGHVVKGFSSARRHPPDPGQDGVGG
jgi:hypothetical protein